MNETIASSFEPSIYDDECTLPIETSSEFVDKAEFLTQRYRKLVAETAIKEEQAEIERMKKLRLQSALVSTDDVTECYQGLGTFIRATLKRSVVELPPRLEGLPAADMIPLLTDYIENICAELSAYGNEHLVY